MDYLDNPARRRETQPPDRTAANRTSANNYGFGVAATARGEGRLARLIRSLERTRLLIIDDWGPEPLNAEQRRDLLEIVDDREGKGSLLITSQVPIGRWHEIIGDPTLGDAILDRVIHRSHRIELKGESLRKRQALAALGSLTNAKEK